MQIKLITAAGILLAGTGAAASTVLNTSLPALNGSFGGGVATTTTGPTGTTITVVGPAGGANRASAANNGSWYQTDVGGGGSVGINTNYLNDNGSIYFSTVGTASKADLSHTFPALVPLSSFTSASFQFYRDGASTAAQVAPVLRLGIFRDNGGNNISFAGYLILDNFSATGNIAPDNVWTTVSATQTTSNFYTTNPVLGPTFTAGQKTIAQWLSANTATPLYVFGVNTGVGSGWNNTFAGAVDHIQFDFANGPTGNFDFAVATAGVPEPQNWVLLIAGFGLVGGAARLRRRTIAPIS